MDIIEAFTKLIDTWEKQPSDFRNKYKSYKSKFLAGNFREVGHRKMREILIEAGFKENWKAPKRKASS
jgi:hypothetical protein